MTSLRGGVMYIAAAMMSILLLVSDGISVENVMPSISTLKPASAAIALTRSTMMPSIVFVFVSRKVNGTPVGVEPTLSTLSWDHAGPCTSSAANATPMMVAMCLSFMTVLLSWD